MFCVLTLWMWWVPTVPVMAQADDETTAVFLLEARAQNAEKVVMFFLSDQFSCSHELEPRSFAIPFKQYIADTYNIPIGKIAVRFWKGSESYISTVAEKQGDKHFQANDKLENTNWDGCGQ